MLGRVVTLDGAVVGDEVTEYVAKRFGYPMFEPLDGHVVGVCSHNG
jgi:hypothetical protein